jgi:hypothetical protein
MIPQPLHEATRTTTTISRQTPKRRLMTKRAVSSAAELIETIFMSAERNNAI